MVWCKGCAQDLDAELFALDKARSTGRRYKCRACSSAEFKRWKQSAGYRVRLDKCIAKRAKMKTDDPKLRWAQTALAASKMRARKHGLDHTITLGWLVAAANDMCPLLEVPLSYNNTRSHGDSAAVDRIDSTKGYIPGNCWVISMLANRIKTNATVDQIETVARNLREVLDLVTRKVDNTPEIVHKRVNPYSQ